MKITNTALFVSIVLFGCLSNNDGYYSYNYEPYVDNRPVFRMSEFFNENFEDFTKTRFKYRMAELGLKIEPEQLILTRDGNGKTVRMENIFVHNGFKDGSRYIHSYFLNDKFAFLTFEWYHGFDIAKDEEILKLDLTAKYLEDIINSIYHKADLSLMHYFIDEFFIEEGVDPYALYLQEGRAYLIRNMILDEQYYSLWIDKNDNNIYELILKPKTFYLIIIPENSQILIDKIELRKYMQDRY